MDEINKDNFSTFETDDLACVIDEKLCQLDLLELNQAALKLTIKEEDLEGKKKYHVKGLITKHYARLLIDDDEDDEETKKEQKSQLFTIVAMLTDITNKKKEETNDATVDEGKQKEQDKVQVVSTKSGNHTILKELGLLKSSGLLRKELKIRGQIGEAGQKDKLTFASLMHQIRNAEAAGYEEEEIVASIIGSMVPSLTLRTVLETTPSLTLTHLTQFLEAHYGEQNATDLCSKLTSAVQLPDESAYTFIMKCIELRQKLLLASEKSDVKYDNNLVQTLFRKALERGLSSSYILQEIRETLRSSPSDQDIISIVCKASSAEKERMLIQSKAKKSSLRVLETSANNPTPPPKVSTESDDTLKKLVSAVESMNTQISSLQSQLTAVKSGRDRRYVKKCNKCLNNNVEICKHCFECGSGYHMARYCDKSRNPSN